MPFVFNPFTGTLDDTGPTPVNGVPTVVDQGQTFVVPFKYQLTFSSPIDCEGVIVFDGLLIEVT